MRVSDCRLVEVVGVDRATSTTHYLVTLHLACGHDATQRWPLGMNMHGRRDDWTSLNRRKADRLARATRVYCIACGPAPRES